LSHHALEGHFHEPFSQTAKLGGLANLLFPLGGWVGGWVGCGGVRRATNADKKSIPLSWRTQLKIRHLA